MIKLIWCSILSIFVFGCSPTYMQLFKTDSQNIPHSEDLYTFENDTVKIIYSFWTDGGVMAFSIFNKLNKPLYIDWKKSTYISNSNKFNYWEDIETTKSLGVSSGYLYNKPSYLPAYFTSIGVTSSEKSKPERITFIPPQTLIYQSKYYITLNLFKEWGEDYEKIEEPRHGKPNKKTIIYKKQFTREESPIVFRNFLTFSLNEDFTEEFYVDNEFYIKEIWSMDEKHFSYWEFPSRGSEFAIELFPYRRGIDFFKERD